MQLCFRLVLIVTMLVALFTLYHSPPLQIAENTSSFLILEPHVATDPRYISTVEINWNHMSHIVRSYLPSRSEYHGIGFLNVNNIEIDQWKEVMKFNCEHVALHLDHAADNFYSSNAKKEAYATGNDGTFFNSGLMVVEPSNVTFKLLMDHVDEVVSYNGGDQGYLNEIFTWWHRIPKHMNFLKHFREGDNRLKTKLFGSNPPVLYVVHYLGYKPWLCFRDYDCNWNVEHYHLFASDEAHKTWWRVHDAMPESLQRFCLLRRQAEKGKYIDGHWKIKIEDKRLETCFETFCDWESMLLHWGETNTTGKLVHHRFIVPVAVVKNRRQNFRVIVVVTVLFMVQNRSEIYYGLVIKSNQTQVIK
ncbi:hypothetical protein Bca52824_025021 [Brassica carinata]|uniref:Hexosyltransferase n=1 Tax=Brassica carinata TaxID=52824 RepID=A0A8X8AUF3_BRACI|nr:hypothetical protein Bca52824_025021 [Brassica carinata]